MTLHETRIERAERRLREAEANVERQQEKLAKLQEASDQKNARSGRQVLQSFKDVVVAMKLRLREARGQRRTDRM